jgi:hypothetical protein
MAGVMTTRGWSLFEAIEMCEAMGIEPVVTIKSTETYQDLGDLVEYLLRSIYVKSKLEVVAGFCAAQPV